MTFRMRVSALAALALAACGGGGNGGTDADAGDDAADADTLDQVDPDATPDTPDGNDGFDVDGVEGDPAGDTVPDEDAGEDTVTDAEDPDTVEADGDAADVPADGEEDGPDGAVLPLGSPCAADGECVSGHCNDSVCCLTATCADCRRCDLSGLGVCTVVGSGTPCGGGMDQPVCNPDSCDSSGNCVNAVVASPGTPCGGALVDPICDPDACDASGTCLDSPPAGISTPCGGGIAQPECDPDHCDGSGACVDEALASPGTPCGPGVVEPICNPDSCDLAGACTDAETASIGTPCGGGIAEPTCDADACDSSGACTDAPPAPDGTLCADGLYCTGADSCFMGSCSHAGDPCAPVGCIEGADVCSTAFWVNEIHYDNSSTDSGEGIEVAGPAGADLAGFRIVLYSGNDGSEYGTIDLTGVVPDLQAGYGAMWFAYAGVQNGAPDGFALVDPVGAVVQFLSYEGTFTASEGPAAGLLSVDIGVDEDPAPAAGMSIQLTGSGHAPGDFTWSPGLTATPGLVNVSQVFL